MATSRWAGGIPKPAWDGTGATFDIPASDQGRRIWVEFDGAFRDVTGVREWLLYRSQRQRLCAVPV